jgi:hypothetical protein
MIRKSREAARLEDARRRQAATAPPLVEVIRGTLVRSLLTCGKAGCRCRRLVRDRHGPYWYVAVSYGRGRQRRYLIPAAHVARARRGIAAYQRLWGALCRVSEINLALLRLKREGE